MRIDSTEEGEAGSRLSVGSNQWYTSRVRIERFGGGVRRAYLPIDGEVLFGVHDEIAEHYAKASGEYDPHAATLDYIRRLGRRHDRARPDPRAGLMERTIHLDRPI